MTAARPPVLPTPHPVATLTQFLWSRENAQTCALLGDQSGLSLSYNARGMLLEVGTELLAAQDGRDEVLVPAFHCPSGITPLIKAGLKPVFYRIGRDLRLDHEDLLAKVTPRTRAVLAIHFFGFEYDLAPLQPLRAQGIALIEDWSHSFLQVAPLQLPRLQGDYQVFSFWKLVPSVVGGGLRRLSGGTPWQRLQPGLKESVVRFKQTLEEVLAHSPHRRSHALFQAMERWRIGPPPSEPSASANATAEARRGEDYYPFNLALASAGIPQRARRMLMAADLAEAAQLRRRNYQVYACGLPSDGPLQPLFARLDDRSCPWVFPVLLRNRDQIDRQWRAQGVALHTFGIYLHSALESSGDRAMIDDAHALARECLCLAVHQDLHPDAITRSLAIMTRAAAV